MAFQNWCEAGLVGLAMLVNAAHTLPPISLSPASPVTAVSLTISWAAKYPKGSVYPEKGFIEHLPAGYGRPGVKHPLLIAFHGRGENGPGTAESLENLRNNGITRLMWQGKWPATSPFVVLAPQEEGGGCPLADEVKAFLDFAMNRYQVDPRRVYFTGLSCGARGIADYFAAYGGKKIAAAVLIAGDLSPAVVARDEDCALARETSLWVFHGDSDDIVPDSGDKAAMKRLLRCQGRKDLRYDSYAKIRHDSWTRAYSTSRHDVFAWMLSHRADVPHEASAHPR